MQAGRVRWHTLMYLYSAHASVTHCRRVSPLGREGLAILALRKLYRQPYFFAAVPSRSPWQFWEMAPCICHSLLCSSGRAGIRDVPAPPSRMTSLGKWAPWKRTALVALLLGGGDRTGPAWQR